MRLQNPSSPAPANVDGPLLKEGLPHTTGFSDALGDRQLVFDPAAAASLEVLRFKPRFGNSPEFEAALMARVEQLSHLQHPSIAAVHTVGRHDKVGLVLVSKHTAGRRVSDLLPKAQGPAFALELIRLVTPALAALQRSGDDVAHGALSADRIVVTRDGRLVVVEHVLGSAIESLGLSRPQLVELGLAVPAGSEPVRLDARADMAQLGFIALSLLLGRKLEAADYPDQVPALLDEFAKAAGSPAVGSKLRSWLERAMQLSPKSFANAREAQAAFHDLPDEIEVQAAAFVSPLPAAISTSGPSALLEFPSEVATPSRVTSKAAPVVTPRRVANKSSRTPMLVGGGVALIALAASVWYAWPALRPAAQPEVQPRVETASVLAPLPTPTSTPVATAPTDLAQPSPTSTPTPTPTAKPAASTPTSTSSAVATENLAQAPAAPTPTPATPRFGGMTIGAALALQVYEGERLIGSSAAPIAVNEGAHNIELVNEATGFRLRQTVNVKAGQMSTLNIALPTAKVSVNAVPWAEVEINGKAHGETPLANLSLPIGTHEFTFRHPQLGVRKQTVVVKVDGLTRITQVFDK